MMNIQRFAAAEGTTLKVREDEGFIALDPVAVDQACIDMIWNSTDPGRDHFIERVERQNDRHILPYAEEIGLGRREYELIEID